LQPFGASFELGNHKMAEKAFHELLRILDDAVRVNADGIEIEWEGADLIVYYQFGNTGVGSACIPEDLQQSVIEELVQRAGLQRKSKGKMRVNLLGTDYEALVREYESFGESAFHLKLRKAKTG
jgi:hypothetical protein